MRSVYIIWAVVPLTLVFISIRGFYKYRLRKGLRDDYRFSLRQGIYAAVILGLAIVCDINLFDPLMESFQVQDKVSNIVRFLVYPGVLLVVSILQGLVTKRKEKDVVRRKIY